MTGSAHGTGSGGEGLPRPGRRMDRHAAKTRRDRAKTHETTKPAKRKTATKIRTEPRLQGSGLHWSIAEATLLLACVFLTFVLKDVALGSTVVQAMPPEGMAITRLVVLSVFYLVFLVIVALLARRRGVRLWEAVGLTRARTSFVTKLAGIGLVVLLLLGTRAVSIAYLFVVRAIGWDPPAGLDISLTEPFGGGPAGLIAAIAIVVVLGPLVEEIVFRGVVQRSLVSHIGSWGAIGLASALFAAYHFTLWLAFPTFVLGLALGWLAHERAALWPAVVLHGAYNATAVAVAYWLEMTL